MSNVTYFVDECHICPMMLKISAFIISMNWLPGYLADRAGQWEAGSGSGLAGDGRLAWGEGKGKEKRKTHGT